MTPAAPGRRLSLCCSGSGLRTALEIALREAGYSVTACDCGEPAALDALRAAAPDVIVLETRAREPDGQELCQSIAADDTLVGARLLLLQDGGREIDRRRAAALGAHGVLAMPFGLDSLRGELDRLLAGG